MSYKLEPVIWPRDTGQRILCFDRCQLIIAAIAWMSNPEVHGEPRLYVSGNLLFRVWPPCCVTPSLSSSYAPTSNTASHDNHEKINSWVSFAFLYVFEYGAALGCPSGHQSSAIRKASGFHRWENRFGLNFFVKETLLFMVKPGRQNHCHTRSICPVPVALIESSAKICFFLLTKIKVRQDSTWHDVM